MPAASAALVSCRSHRQARGAYHRRNHPPLQLPNHSCRGPRAAATNEGHSSATRMESDGNKGSPATPRPGNEAVQSFPAAGGGGHKGTPPGLAPRAAPPARDHAGASVTVWAGSLGLSR
eukprot:CAMPEP_0174314052 /NCGR_PEP_ID=MMETSP0810-20121108/5396_1 /TAXON_ID=73025 ORGANISM="Eutreptiella gymnastica-like, Strain CCMP1594" /NCGR_SAMPLE_ID=MMETSP0810 /ASSEMBLY_ACC=CAM_ASM_000659 /LENGTH=118 /DNA_ID=CAMNT_0015423043 /DNA_START=112 /DNA_END=465 /DNA_ORIENTATION=+